MPPTNKRQAQPPPPSPPPAVSSSGEEEEEEEEEQQQNHQIQKQVEEQETESEDDDDEEEDSDSDDENEDVNLNKLRDDIPSPSTKPKSIAPAEQENSSTETEDSSSEDDDEPPPLKSAAPRNSRSVDLSVKPISTKPMGDSTKPSSNDNGSMKRKRENAAAFPENEQKKLFQRLWTLEDELEVLRSLILCKDKNGSLPVSQSDMVAFYDLVRPSLTAEINKVQLVDKMRRLRKKFENNEAKRKNDADPKLSNQHERALYELSRKLWGGDVGINKAKVEDEGERKKARASIGGEETFYAKDEVKVSNSMMISELDEEIKIRYPYLVNEVDKIASEHPCGVALKVSLGALNEAKARVMDDKFKQLRAKELKQQVRRIELLKESVKLISDALTRSD